MDLLPFRKLKLLDVLRSGYIRLPLPVKSIVSPLASALPGKLKYGGTYIDFKKLIEKSYLDCGLVECYQLERLRELLLLGYRKSDFYRGLLLKAGLSEYGINSFQLCDLQKIPILSKKAITGNVDRMLVTSRNLVDEVSTSGSSGRPTVFYLDKDRSVKEWAYIHSYWAKAGFNVNDSRAVLRGIHIQNVDDQPWEYEGALKELRLSPFHLTEKNMRDYLSEIEKRNIRYLNGYPSALHILAKFAEVAHWDYSGQIAGIFPISESLHLHQRQEIQQTFPNSKILPFYGLSEKTAFATEVQGYSGLYEFDPTYGITELVDDLGNNVVELGDRGRIVSTGLLHLGMPLIRYDTGDIATLRQIPTHDNGYRIRVSNIQSRWNQEFVVGASGELISISALNIHSPNYRSIKEFQFCQDKKGLVDVEVVPQAWAKESDLEEFVKEIQQKVGSTVLFELKTIQEIKRNQRGKTRMIVQKLNTDKVL